MESEKLTSGLLARYLANSCSKQERQRVEQWADKSEENTEKLKEFIHIWNVSEINISGKGNDIGERWEELNQSLKEEIKSDPSVSDRHLSTKRKRSSTIHSASQRIMRYAAIFLVVGFIGFLSYQKFYQPEPEPVAPALREISTNNGQRVNLTLSDGSKVLLNAGSSLKLPKKFGPDIRKVFLEGEAYFNVSKNPNKPFHVHSRGSVTRVLGTSFTIRSYEEEQQVQVVVKEGRVALGKESQDKSSPAILTANELGQYHTSTQDVETEQVDDMQLYLGWIDGYLKFRSAPMSAVAKALERRYGVKVHFREPDIKQESLTAILKSRSIRSVLDVITKSLDIAYRLDKDNLTFYK